MALPQTAAQENMNMIRAWIDAHNRQDMKALDYMDENIEIIEIPTGVVYKGMTKMKELAAQFLWVHKQREVPEEGRADIPSSAGKDEQLSLTRSESSGIPS